MCAFRRIAFKFNDVTDVHVRCEFLRTRIVFVTRGNFDLEVHLRFETAIKLIDIMLHSLRVSQEGGA